MVKDIQVEVSDPTCPRRTGTMSNKIIKAGLKKIKIKLYQLKIDVR